MDVNGGFLENSTAYQIFDLYMSGVMIDYEKEHRYYAPRKAETFNSHPFVFQRFCKSIKLKYILEMVICGSLAFLFQYYISLYIAKTSDFYNFSIERSELYTVLDAIKKSKMGQPEKILELKLKMSPIELELYETKYIPGNMTLVAATVKEFSTHLENAGYVMILIWICTF